MGCTNSTMTTGAAADASKSNNVVGEERAPTTKKVVVAGSAPEASPTISNKLALGAGCFWGTEKYVYKDFQKKFPGSIKSAQVGFMSPLDRPRIKNPTYREVCSGTSGHVEVLFVELNDPQKHFEELCRFFFSFHDPTLKDRQGNDRGFQYSSLIFCGDEEQFEIARKVKSELQAAIDEGSIKTGVFGTKKVETQICDLKEFTKAEDEHQQYLLNNPNGYCNHRMRLKQWYTLQ